MALASRGNVACANRTRGVSEIGEDLCQGEGRGEEVSERASEVDVAEGVRKASDGTGGIVGMAVGRQGHSRNGYFKGFV